jgi:subtilisin family serine protease
VIRAALAVAVLAVLPATAFAAPAATDRYIVVLDDSADSQAVAREHGKRYGASDRTVYSFALNGYAAKIPPSEIGAVRSDPRVKYVEPDAVVTADTTQTPAPSWGLDRIDQRALPLSGSYNYTRTGSGVTAYIIDTGIRRSHTDFGGRASWGADFVSPSTGGQDCDGHGTHVAGTVGGTTYGVAKLANLVAVRVLDCSGSGYWSWIIAGIDWVTAHHATPAVANMSLGGRATQSVDDAVSRSIASGVAYSISAGNSGQDACKYSPARTPAAITIGATDSTDTRASWSNWGSCVDWFAPGVSIKSDYNASDTATSTLSGTSMASPHTTGVLARYFEVNPTATPAAARSALFSQTTKNIVKDPKSANAHLLYRLPGY